MLALRVRQSSCLTRSVLLNPFPHCSSQRIAFRLAEKSRHGMRSSAYLLRFVFSLLVLASAASLSTRPAEAQAIVGATPAFLFSGTFTLTLYGSQLPANPTVILDGKPLTVTASGDWYIIATGYLPPWKSGDLRITVTSPSSGGAQWVISVAPTPASFDAAARFATQAAFGPRPDVVAAIQQRGLDGWITDQLYQPPIVYDPTQASRPQFLRAASSGNTLLRLRVAWALQTFLVSQCMFLDASCIPYEQTLERDATANFRDLLTDLSSDTSMGQFLNLAGNAAPTDPTQHPNQNFAREIMQLFALGPNLLNDDGSLQLDAFGNPIPAYTQDQVVDLSRVFTGWVLPTPASPYVELGVDYLQPLQAVEAQHDEGAKTIVGPTVIPSGQGIYQDRKLALDALFNHPNLPPHVARLLIQHLVKSSPSPAYVQRIASVFENDGTSIRGNMPAVIRAILLDPEARIGDTTPAVDDGFLQDPLLFQTFVASTNELAVGDNQSSFLAPSLGEDWWFSPSVFGFYRPDYLIPGTTINSPEFQIFNNIAAINRSDYLWNMLIGLCPGYYQNPNSWLLTHFTTVPDMVDALNHLAFHGQMSAAQQAAIIAYCNSLPATDPATQLRSAIFLALNSDGFTVSQ